MVIDLESTLRFRRARLGCRGRRAARINRALKDGEADGLVQQRYGRIVVGDRTAMESVARN